MTDIPATPRTTKQWTVTGYEGLDYLKFSEEPIPSLGDSQVLVKIQGASLNFRDIIIPQGKYPFDLKPNVVPGSDGAGTVLAVGKHVSRFKPGDKVVMIINQAYLAGRMTPEAAGSGLGGVIDGTFRQIGAFDEQGLVRMPEGLTFVEASTLSCAGLTAWNALFGMEGRRPGPGDWVLSQGTGGVSLFVVQFAKAAGARVIATTSSTEKGKVLERLGADHIINYRTRKDWGVQAKELTGGVGVDIVVDIAGPTSLAQSVEAVRLDGLVCTMGFVGGEGKTGESGPAIPSVLDCWTKLFTARGLWVGSRSQMEDMCRAIEADSERLRPVVDDRVFKLEELKDAYEYLSAGKHQGKVCIAFD